MKKNKKRTFEELKEALIPRRVLKIYRPTTETELHTDAYTAGLGAVLIQKDSQDGKFYPVHFANWKTTPTVEKYSSYDLETLAVVKSLKKFRVYLLGYPLRL